jgi:hypothetical protein
MYPACYLLTCPDLLLLSFIINYLFNQHVFFKYLRKIYNLIVHLHEIINFDHHLPNYVKKS